jgi:hypothetical protein
LRLRLSSRCNQCNNSCKRQQALVKGYFFHRLYGVTGWLGVDWGFLTGY